MSVVPATAVPAPTRESPGTPFTTGLTAAFAPNKERIVTRFEDDLELEVHQDATDASPLHTVLLADPERGVVWGGSSEGGRAGVILKMGRAAADFAIVVSELHCIDPSVFVQSIPRSVDPV